MLSGKVNGDWQVIQIQFPQLVKGHSIFLSNVYVCVCDWSIYKETKTRTVHTVEVWPCKKAKPLHVNNCPHSPMWCNWVRARLMLSATDNFTAKHIGYLPNLRGTSSSIYPFYIPFRPHRNRYIIKNEKSTVKKKRMYVDELWYISWSKFQMYF